jgi:hypothetical protein
VQGQLELQMKNPPGVSRRALVAMSNSQADKSETTLHILSKDVGERPPKKGKRK